MIGLVSWVETSSQSVTQWQLLASESSPINPTVQHRNRLNSPASIRAFIVGVAHEKVKKKTRERKRMCAIYIVQCSRTFHSCWMEKSLKCNNSPKLCAFLFCLMQWPFTVAAALVLQQWSSRKQQLLSHGVQLTILGQPSCLVLISVDFSWTSSSPLLKGHPVIFVNHSVFFSFFFFPFF